MVIKEIGGLVKSIMLKPSADSNPPNGNIRPKDVYVQMGHNHEVLSRSMSENNNQLITTLNLLNTSVQAQTAAMQQVVKESREVYEAVRSCPGNLKP